MFFKASNLFFIVLSAIFISQASCIVFKSRQEAIDFLKGEDSMTVKEAVMTNNIDNVRAAMFLNVKDETKDPAIITRAMLNKNYPLYELLTEKGYAMPSKIPDGFVLPPSKVTINPTVKNNQGGSNGSSNTQSSGSNNNQNPNLKSSGTNGSSNQQGSGTNNTQNSKASNNSSSGSNMPQNPNSGPANNPQNQGSNSKNTQNPAPKSNLPPAGSNKPQNPGPGSNQPGQNESQKSTPAGKTLKETKIVSSTTATDLKELVLKGPIGMIIGL